MSRFFLHHDVAWMTEPCPSRTDDITNHCWHRGMVTYTSAPSQHDETCCYCGETIRVQDAPSSGGFYGQRPEDHGPHFPTYTAYNVASPFSAKAPLDNSDSSSAFIPREKR